MKNLELMGVQEMDAKEMRNENGGNELLWAFAFYVALEIVGNPKAHAKAFNEGFNEGWADATK